MSDEFDDDVEDLELDYDASKLTQEELETKLDKVNSDLEYHEDMASQLTGEQNYLYDEKNKRYHERKAKELADKTSKASGEKE